MGHEGIALDTNIMYWSNALSVCRIVATVDLVSTVHLVMRSFKNAAPLATTKVWSVGDTSLYVAESVETFSSASRDKES